MNSFHIPVLLNEAIDYLNVQPNKWYLDCNIGGGGHTSQILKLRGKVIGLDLDQAAINEVQIKIGQSENLKTYQINFANLDQVVKEVAGVLFDLGVSSYQLDRPERGFSFNQSADLDMRMDPNIGATAKDLVNGLYEPELARLFLEFGQESWAKPIAKKIVQVRKTEPITRTDQLAEIVRSVKRSEGKIDPATQVFQALRLAVNDELNNLKVALPKALSVLEPGGRVVVISFHSLEDKIVKDFFNSASQNGQLKILTKKPIAPSDQEIANNPRSRSAKMRVAEKL